MIETIKLVNLDKQIIKGKKQFAWYDLKSIEGQFLQFDEKWIWATWDEFEADFWSEMDYRAEEGSGLLTNDIRKYLSRFTEVYQNYFKRKVK